MTVTPPQPDPSVSRRAHETAKRLAELLEMLGLYREADQVRSIRAKLALM